MPESVAKAAAEVVDSAEVEVVAASAGHAEDVAAVGHVVVVEADSVEDEVIVS